MRIQAWVCGIPFVTNAEADFGARLYGWESSSVVPADWLTSTGSRRIADGRRPGPDIRPASHGTSTQSDDRAMQSSTFCNDAVARLASRGRFLFFRIRPSSDHAQSRRAPSSCSEANGARTLRSGDPGRDCAGSPATFAESEMAYFSRKYALAAFGLRNDMSCPP